ncbi:MAG: Slp family lipoprotein [Gammaproteobacteria bacterium]|nr:Slp family lipoprotein [Gammaproteobacteria bacterium]
MLLMVVVAALSTACTTGVKRADTGPTPAEVMAAGEARGAVHWGGRIVRVENLRTRTRIELLSLPLDREGRPQTDARPQGRFIVEHQGFLEPQEFAPQRLLEVYGQLDGFISAKVGDTSYRYPLVREEKLVLWDRPEYVAPSSPRINFGIGVGIGF